VNLWLVLIITVATIVVSAFFVIMEFSLMGARRYRLEAQAEQSRAARAALRSMNELTIMLAGAQLGITACTFILGAVTKPAVDSLLAPLIGNIGLPDWISGSASFILALFVVTFLHLVIGEMAPKSWAIAHPETAAKATSLVARTYIWLLAPLLRWINTIANRLVAASGVEPVDRAAVGGRDAETIRRLVEHSAAVGTLEEDIQAPVSGALDLETLQVRDLIADDTPPVAVHATDTVADLQAAAMSSRHLRILVQHPNADLGVLHVRDTLLEPSQRTVGELARPALTFAPDTPLHAALRAMRDHSEQLAVVVDDTRLVGLVTFSDAIRRLLPQPDAPEA